MSIDDNLPSTLLSVHPRFAAAILDGTKTVEIRRRRAHLPIGSVALIYATSPLCQVVGAARIAHVEFEPVDRLWDRVGARTALSRAEFEEYVGQREEACAITVSAVVAFSCPISLKELRRRRRGFVTPQSYRFLAVEESAALLESAASELRPLTRQMRLELI
jgi:predicted transcriptional regulator